MIEWNEGFQMTLDEIAAVVSLSGRQGMVGFRTEEMNNLTPERLWDACCRLMRDAMMTHVDGKFRLSRELMAVMRPVCLADSVLILTPASDLYAQVIYYVADQVCAMRPTPFGRFVLRLVERHELAEALETHLDLSYPEQTAESETQPPVITVATDADTRELLEGALFLLERVEPATGQRIGWIRVMEQGALSWLQWTDNKDIGCVPLTKQALSELLQTL